MVLKYGSSGGAVTTWQHSLNLENKELELPETGNFRNLTTAGTIEFQRKYGLTPDGIVGPITQGKMTEILAGHIPPVEKPKGSVMVLDIYGGNSVTSFASAHAAGVKGIIHKASQGIRTRDSLIASRSVQIRQAGMNFGAYLFFEPSLDADAQMETFLSVVAKLQKDGDFPWSLDYGEYDLSSRQANREGALQVLRRMEIESGLIPMCYGATGLLNQYDLPAEFARYAPWLANGTENKLASVQPWGSKWVLHQYAESKAGQIPGIGAGADINKFNGSYDDLEKFIKDSKR